MRATILGLGLVLVGCDVLPQVGEGGYEMRDVGIRDVELEGDLGPIAQLNDDVDTSEGISCPGELTFTFESAEPEGDVRMDLRLNEVVPDLAPGEVFRVESEGDDALEMVASVSGGDEEWVGEALRAEMVLIHLGFDVYEVAFSAVLLGEDLTESVVSGHFSMDRAALDESPWPI